MGHGLQRRLHCRYVLDILTTRPFSWFLSTDCQLPSRPTARFYESEAFLMFANAPFATRRPTWWRSSFARSLSRAARPARWVEGRTSNKGTLCPV